MIILKSMIHSYLSWTALLAILFMSSCQTTKQARTATPSNFLANPQQLKPGEKGNALLVYGNDEYDFGKYSKVMFSPIAVYPAPKSKLDKLKPEDKQAMADYLQAAIREKVGEVFEIVDEPGPDTFIIRMALTEGRLAQPFNDLMNNIMPYNMAYSGLKNLATGAPASVGRAQIELELIDSMTKERFGAAIDARVGGTTFDGKFDKWDDVQTIFDYWAEDIRDRLKASKEAAR